MAAAFKAKCGEISAHFARCSTLIRYIVDETRRLSHFPSRTMKNQARRGTKKAVTRWAFFFVFAMLATAAVTIPTRTNRQPVLSHTQAAEKTDESLSQQQTPRSAKAECPSTKCPILQCPYCMAVSGANASDLARYTRNADQLKQAGLRLRNVEQEWYQWDRRSNELREYVAANENIDSLPKGVSSPPLALLRLVPGAGRQLVLNKMRWCHPACFVQTTVALF